MNILKFFQLSGVVTAACIMLNGCATSSGDAGSAEHVRVSDTLLPPVSPDSPSSPTAGSANADPHGFDFEQ